MIIMFCIHTERWNQSLHWSDLSLDGLNILMNAGRFIIRNGLRLMG
jgi:hypothetical protein